MPTTDTRPHDRSATDGVATASRARALTKVYGSGAAAVRALDAVDVDFASGAFTAIMGPSGSGKSTLMHLLAGLDDATSGTAHLGSTEITTLDDDALTRLRRDRVGFVFQSFNLLPMLTAEQNIVLPLDLAGRRPDRAWFDTLVTTLGLQARLTHRPSELSGGQQQRVAIARALVAQPEVVFADEPTGNLDSRSGAEVLSFLRRSVRELGRTIIMVTHDPTAAAYADRVLLLADGRIAGDIADPTPESVLAGLEGLRVLEAPAGTPTGATPVVDATAGGLR
ncbi:ABC transporter ATP-binding protein [Cellulomonas phragmiteti]|uniref:ABC transporter ATP-binding protein n=1 Tax=Cellulomonas phragmiteti TaxID=478780 RepID=A0ABQ4DJT1_9CELL|nr:ABC transporter ATP-binding protein [Cellulomonas phragmiteti]GIG39590.1 ABC transporter ATP-binding protein [Cellulomonas phragmiteti]